MQTYDSRMGTLIWLILGRTTGQCTVFWLAMNRTYNFCFASVLNSSRSLGRGRGGEQNIAITAFKFFYCT